MNVINLTGRITRDLELKVTQSDTHVLNTTIAVKRRRARDGEDDADFIDIECWRNQADYLSSFARKGTTIGVSGELRIDKFTDREGNTRKKIYVRAENVEILSQPKNEGVKGKTVEEENKEFVESVRGTEYGNNFGYGNTFDDSDLTIEESDLPFY